MRPVGCGGERGHPDPHAAVEPVTGHGEVVGDQERAAVVPGPHVQDLATAAPALDGERAVAGVDAPVHAARAAGRQPLEVLTEQQRPPGRAGAGAVRAGRGGLGRGGAGRGGEEGEGGEESERLHVRQYIDEKLFTKRATYAPACASG